MNDNQITTKDMFEILRSDISEVKAQISEVRSDLHALDDRLRKVEEVIGGAIKAFFS